jgi:hypothetical protein
MFRKSLPDVSPPDCWGLIPNLSQKLSHVSLLVGCYLDLRFNQLVGAMALGRTLIICHTQCTHWGRATRASGSEPRRSIGLVS